MGQIKLMSSIIFIGLFCVALLSFAVNFANDNNSNYSLSENSEMISISDNIRLNVTQTVKEDFNRSSEAFSGSTLTGDDDETTGGGQFKVGIFSSTGMLTSAMTAAFSTIFGKDNGFGIFISAFLGFIVYIFGLYAIKSWRGNPD